MQISDFTEEIHIKTFGEDEIVFSEGDFSDSTMYCLLEGAASVCKDRNGSLAEINTIYDGEFFGEIGLIQNVPRLATIRIVSPKAKVAIISKNNFYSIIQKKPSFLFLFLKSARERVFQAESKIVRLLESTGSDVEFDVSKTRIDDWNILGYVNQVSTKTFKNKDIVLDSEEREDEQLHFVIEGMVRVERKAKSGRFYEVNVLTPGELFGNTKNPLEDNYPLRVTAITEPTQTGTLERNMFGKVCQLNPEFLFHVIKTLLWRLHVTEDKISHLVNVDT
ncbi:MAG: cyclic nucleotide-binding domain-containing protein [Spirochaetota bacterium]